MSLRAKTVLGVILGMAATGALLFGLFNNQVAGAFRDLEKSLAQNRLRLVDKLCQSALAELAGYCRGLTQWDDAVAVAENPGDDVRREEFVAGAFGLETLVDYDIAFAVMATLDGKVVFAVGQGEGHRPPPSIVDKIPYGSPLMPRAGGPDIQVSREGFLALDGRVYMVVSQPVLPHSAAPFTPRGRMVIGRALDGKTLDAVQRMADFPVAIVKRGPDGAPADWKDAIPAALAGRVPEACADASEGRLDATLPDGRLAGGVVLRDAATGEPVAALWARLPAAGARTADAVRRFFLGALAALLLLAGAALYLQVEFSLLRPLAAIQDALAEINRTGDRNRRVPCVGGREFVRHAERINATLDGLQAAEADVARRLRVEEALAEAARLLVAGGPGALVACLRALGEKLDVDVVSYYALDGADGQMRCAGTFRDPRTHRFAGSYQFRAPAAEWIVEATRAGRPIEISDTARLPADKAGVGEFVREYDLSAFLAMPMKGGGAGRTGAEGVVAFGLVGRTNRWSPEDQRALSVIAELLGCGTK